MANLRQPVPALVGQDQESAKQAVAADEMASQKRMVQTTTPPARSSGGRPGRPPGGKGGSPNLSAKGGGGPRTPSAQPTQMSQAPPIARPDDTFMATSRADRQGGFLGSEGADTDLNTIRALMAMLQKGGGLLG